MIRLITGLFLIAGTTNAQVTFNKTFGGAQTDILRNVRETSDGGFVGVGYTASQGLGYVDLYLVKTNNYGEIQWEKTIGSPMVDVGYTVKVLSNDELFLTGYTEKNGTEDIYIAKANAVGDLIWSKTFNKAGVDRPQEGIQTNDGGFAIAGYTSSAPAKYFDGFLMKLNSSGDTMWTKYYGGTEYDNINSLRQLADGGFVLAGQTYSEGAGNGDFYILRTDANGNELWHKTFGGAMVEEAQNLLLSNDGKIIVTGDTESSGSGKSDAYVIKLDMNGGLVWSKIFGGVDKDVTKTIEHAPDGGLIIAGVTRSFGAFDQPDMWLIKSNSDGDTIWTKRYGKPFHDHGYSAMPTIDGGFILGGHMEASNNNEDFAIVKLNQQGMLTATPELVIDKEVQMFPNPSNGIVNISMKRGDSETIIVSSITGQVILNEKIGMVEEQQLKQLDLSDLDKGTYLISIIGKEKVITRKIILN